MVTCKTPILYRTVQFNTQHVETFDNSSFLVYPVCTAPQVVLENVEIIHHVHCTHNQLC